jgi:hypothetical protein
MPAAETLARRTAAMIHSIVILMISLAAASEKSVQHGAEQTAAPQHAGPKAAVEALARAYRARSIDQYAALLTADYRFHWVNVAQPAQYSGGFDREFEVGSTHAMFTGGAAHNGKPGMRPADSISVVIGELAESTDPEHPDSSEFYRVISANPFHLHVYIAGTKGFDVSDNVEYFHVVRGDAAVLVAGQAADSKTWYIRRWLDDMSGLARTLAQTQGTCDQQSASKSSANGAASGAAVSAADGAANGAANAAANAAAVSAPPAPIAGMRTPIALAIHPLGNPACPTLEISCDIPGTERAQVEVFDVTGRRLAKQALDAPQPGTVVISAGAGVELRPGAYWVRLTQGARTPSTRMVVVAR